MDTPDRYRLITIKQAAKTLGIHPKTIRRYIEMRRLSVYKIPGKHALRVPRDEVEALKDPVPVHLRTATEMGA